MSIVVIIIEGDNRWQWRWDGVLGEKKKYAHNSHACSSTSGTEIARNLHVLRMRTCVPFPPKIIEKTLRSARTHLAFHEIGDTLIEWVTTKIGIKFIPPKSIIYLFWIYLFMGPGHSQNFGNGLWVESVLIVSRTVSRCTGSCRCTYVEYLFIGEFSIYWKLRPQHTMT